MIMNYSQINLEKSVGWKILNLLKIKDAFYIPRWFMLTEREDINEDIYTDYMNIVWSEYYICRSSMSNEDSMKLSYAGLFESIEWRISEKLLHNDILDVFQSVENDFLDEYEIKITWKVLEKRKMNVLIQEFIIWEVSWVYFSNFNNGRLIEYIKWCNQFLVDGVVKANKLFLSKNYTIIEHKKNIQYKYIWENLDIYIYEKENNSLTLECEGLLISELSRLQTFYDFEIDVEWTISKWKLYILQVRPITVL